MLLKGPTAVVLGIAAAAASAVAGAEPETGRDGLASDDMATLEKAVAEMLAERKEQIRVALTELEEVFAKPRYREEDVARAEVLMGF
ncbi:MAG: hypothetical protein ACYS9X_30765, partial [Planctomycetota bacterium]